MFSGANKLFFDLVKAITSISSGWSVLDFTGWSVLDFTNVAKFAEIIYQVFKSFKEIKFILSWYFFICLIVV